MIYPSCPVTDEDLEANEPVWKRALMFSIRNLILIALICLYLYAGALLFRFLEVENSKNECVIVGLIVSSCLSQRSRSSDFQCSAF